MMAEPRDRSARLTPSAPRAGTCQSPARFACKATNPSDGRQGGQAPFDAKLSQLLDVQQAALDEIAEGLGHLRAAYRLRPTSRSAARAVLVGL